MLIYCLKCQQGYNVDEELIPDEGRKLHCSKCDETFWFNRTGETEIVKEEPQSVSDDENPAEKTESADEENISDNLLTVENEKKEETPEPKVDDDVLVQKESSLADKEDNSEKDEEIAAEVDEPVDINDIFKRLAEQTEGLFEKEKQLTRRERFWLKFKTLTGWNIRFRYKFIVAFLAVISAISLYNNRYDVARRLPWTASIYGIFGIESQILGEGLEFQNIDWIYFADDEAPRLEIKGFINNPTNRSIDLPTVRVEMLDENAGLLKSQNQKSEQTVLKAKSRLPLSIVVTKPSPTTKYVFLTFVKINN